jgi:peptidoglycan/LPS O-acetylase OafA/YrhL
LAIFLERYGLDPALAILAIALAGGLATAISLLLTQRGGTFGRAVAPGEKIASLEGLRGILALCVVLHHAYCWYFYMRIGVWSTGNSIIFNRFASFGVMQFFYISGYLFWRKLTRGRVSMGRFYLSRFLRIGPVYYLCVGTAILIGVVVTGPHLRVSLANLAASLTSWLLFCLGGLPSINGADTKRIVAGVMWTLAAEWGFYLLLPLLGWFSKKAHRLLWYALLFAGLWFLSRFISGPLAHIPHMVGGLLEVRTIAKFMLIGFGGGILVAALEPRLSKLNWLSGTQKSGVLLMLYLTYLLVPGIEDLGQIFLLCGFVLVTQGVDLFGFLTSRGIRLLGIVSYDIYVVHGIIYYLATRLRGGIHPVPLPRYILETALSIVVIVVVSTVIHFIVERPAMIVSERIARGSKQRSTPAAPIAA